jgi:hypothetical protein
MCKCENNIWPMDVKVKEWHICLVINFINWSWVPCHIIVGLFETLDISKVVLEEWMKVLLVKFNLTSKVIVYVKDKRTNLIPSNYIHFYCVMWVFIVALVVCWLLFWSCYVKGMLVCMNEAKVGVDMKEVNLKDALVMRLVCSIENSSPPWRFVLLQR